MSARRRKAQRVIAVVAATLISLACGTNYSYSAWAPQFAERMKLSSTESNLIGGAGNLGMYACGIPVGLIVDAKGPLPGLLLGAASLGIGYFPIYRAYEGGPGSMGVPLLLFFSFISGLGGCSAFSGAIKAAAMNYPNHRGTATSFPLAAFGLSAFFFSTISTIAFKGDTAKFLLLLSLGTCLLILVSSVFVRIVPPQGTYSVLPSQEHRSDLDEPPTRTRAECLRLCETSEIGTQNNFTQSRDTTANPLTSPSDPGVPYKDPDETSSLVSKSAAASIISEHEEDVLEDEPISHLAAGSPNADIRGLALIGCPEFWQLFMMMGLLAGIGLMTINNIGNDVKALWKYYDDSAEPAFIQQQQVMHVGILSILSFIGRLLSGIGSDILVQKLHRSRLWCLFVSSSLFCVTQFAGTQISNPHHLIVVSCLSGLGYGFLFGVYPSLVAHMFGIKGLSQNWGAMTLAPVISGNVFNLLYGSIFDRHSMVAPNGERDCREGLQCYKSAYWVTFFSAVSGIVLSLWCIWYEKRALARWNMGKKALA